MLDLEICSKDIIDNYYKYFLSLENVNGIGYGYKYINNKNTLEPCLHVFVDNKVNIKSLSSNNIIPSKYMGIKTDVIQVKSHENEIITRQNLDIAGMKVRPLQAGCEIGCLGTSEAGTVSCIVKKKIKKSSFYDYYILSNNHVLADFGKKPIGTKFTQPFNGMDALDATDNIIAELSTFVPIQFSNNLSDNKARNSVDCAIAKILDNSLISNEIIGLGKIKGTKKAKVGMKVAKIGRSTGITTGSVHSINVTTVSNISIWKYYIKDQIYTSIATAPGDSGAPIVTENNYIIAIHCGRKSLGLLNTVSRGSDINIILDKLKVKLFL